MKFDSPIFDRIRLKPGEVRRVRPGASCCDWPGCAQVASYRAPKGRLREGEYWGFCLDHVRQYNQSYNFFAGMSDAAVARYQKEAVTGHRPTWKMGVNGRNAGAGRFGAAGTEGERDAARDPFDILREIGGGASWRPQSDRVAPEGRTVRNAERKALGVLGLETDATAAEIKARFKVLVKRHHPDANGGDRSCEDRLRDIIQAYNYLKSVRFC